MLSLIILFFHTLLNLQLLWNISRDRRLAGVISPMVWKILIIFSITSILFITQITVQFLFFKILLLYIPSFFIICLRYVLISVWQKQLLVQFEIFLNHLIAQIKIGCSFRTSFKIALTCITSLSIDTRFRNHLTGILESILFSKKIHTELLFSPLQQMIQELQTADRSVQCLEHLENLRHYIRLRTYFRRKVHTALFQVRIQAFVLTVLYVGLLAFVLHQYGLKYLNVLFVSLCCFAFGLIILFQIGKKFKWTI